MPTDRKLALKTFSNNHRPMVCFLLLVPTALCLTGCTGDSQHSGHESANILGPPLTSATGTPLPPYPKGGAQVLSIAGAAPVSGSDPYQVALNCAAAVKTTAQVLAKESLVTTKEQADALRQANNLFGDRAVAAGIKLGHSPAETQASVAARVKISLDDPSSQVRVAATCLHQVTASAR